MQVHMFVFSGEAWSFYENRLKLGYHSNKMRKALTYNKDSAARPIASLSHLLQEMRLQIFEPDNTRSGRLEAVAKPFISQGYRIICV